MKGGDFVLKIKKIMATALVFIMILSLVTIPAMADGALEVVYFNGDSTRLVIDFNHEVDATALKGAMTITKDGEEVAFGVDYVEKTAGVTDAGNLIVSENFTYAIVLDDGIALDEMYEICIQAGLEGSDGCALAQNYEKIFMVDKLWKEDFNYATVADRPWTLFSAIKNKTTLADGILTANAGSGSSGLITNTDSTAIFADTGMPANEFLAEFKKETFYNTEVFVKNVSAHSKSKVVVAHQSTKSNLQHKYNNIICGGLRTDALIAEANVKASTVETNGSVGSYTYDFGGYPISHNAFADADFFKINLMTTEDRNIKVFGDDYNAYGNYYYSSAAASTSHGYVSIGIAGSPTYSIDYVIVTKLRTFEKANYTMTPANGATDVEIADEIKLTFEKPVDPATLSADAVEVYVNDDLTDNYTVDVDEADANSVIVKLDQPMSYRALYKIVPTSVKFLGDETDYMFSSSSFETTMPVYEFTSFEETSGKVSATFANNKIEEGIKGVMSVCLYDEAGKMLNIAIEEIDVAKGEDAKVSVSAGEYYSAKCYIWDSMATMNTITTAVLE